jgi:hypothetical protein
VCRTPLLFDDHDADAAQAARTSVSVVAPAQRSDAAQLKARTKTTAAGQPVHSFRSLLSDLATIVKNRVQPADTKIPAFDIVTTPTALQQQALDLLDIPPRFRPM